MARQEELAELCGIDVYFCPDFGGTFANAQVDGDAMRTCSPYA